MPFSFPSLLIFFVLLVSGSRFQETQRSSFDEPFKTSLIDSVAKLFVSFNDTIPNDTLYFCFSKKNPVAVYRDILSGVCLDGECRPLRIKLYWTITGRYLGYELPPGQELTKKEHTPFTEDEYHMLRGLLGDSLSMLANFSLSEISPKRKANVKTDGISGATPPDISAYIIPEAAYTTHTLWHLVYGETRDGITSLMFNYLKFEVLDSLAKSSDNYDRTWAIAHFSSSEVLPDLLVPIALKVLETSDFRTIQSALDFLYTMPGFSSQYQEELFKLSRHEDYTVRNLAINYLKKENNLNPEVISGMIAELSEGDEFLVRNYLSVLEKCNTLQEAGLQKISMLLDNHNTIISLNAYSFLVRTENKSSWLVRKLKKFEKQKLEM